MRKTRNFPSGRMAILLTTLATWSLASCSAAPVEPTPSEPWATYTNEDYAFAFDFPDEVQVEVEERGPFQVAVYDNPGQPFYIRASRDFLPNDVLYFLDTPASGRIALGDNEWQIHILPDGYGDAVGTSPPIYALQMQAGDVLYGAIFFDQDSLTELQTAILATFRTID